MKNPVSTALRDVLPGRQKNTIASVEAMPAEKFNYKPTADQMTFGHLVVHIAETNDLLCSKAADVPAPKVDEVKETDSKDKLVAAVKASFDFCSDALAKMDDSRLAETTEIFPGRQGFACMGQHDPRRCLGRPLRRSCNVSAPERCVAADRQEVRVGSAVLVAILLVAHYLHR
jgi:hypothetical protein